MDGGIIMATKRKRKWLRISGFAVLFILLGIGAYAFSFYQSLTETVDIMYQPLQREVSEKRTEKVVFETKDPISVLLLGVDEREGDRGRSDTIVVLTVNPEQNSIKMLSIPRDTRTEIIGHGTVDKINHAYAFGGVEMSMATVEEFLDIPIDYYMQINMEGFVDIVDAVGGVTVLNDYEFTSYGVHFPKGKVELNGDKALIFGRMRYEDPRGDFGRQLRQRQIIMAVVKKGASLSSLTNYGNIFNALGKNIRTNLTFDEMVDIQKNYRSASNNIEQIEIKGEGQTINSIYYFIVSDEEKSRVQTALQTHLKLVP